MKRLGMNLSRIENRAFHRRDTTGIMRILALNGGGNFFEINMVKNY